MWESREEIWENKCEIVIFWEKYEDWEGRKEKGVEVFIVGRIFWEKYEN